MVAMVADIAHRSARLNPHLGAEAATITPGVILIDEIDLHLHPKWQRRVVQDLKKTFPNIQFITTTHSPFIIQSLEPGEVIDLNSKYYPIIDGESSPSPKDEYSDKSIEDIIEEIMEIPLPQRSKRLEEMYNTAKIYYELLEESKESDEKMIVEIKEKLDQLMIPFSKNQAFCAFLEMERISAGLHNNNNNLTKDEK